MAQIRFKQEWEEPKTITAGELSAGDFLFLNGKFFIITGIIYYNSTVIIIEFLRRENYLITKSELVIARKLKVVSYEQTVRATK